MAEAAHFGMLESVAFEKFHSDKSAAVLLSDVVDGADVGVIQGGGGFGFALEALEGVRILREIFRKEFQCNGAVQTSVFGFEDNSHSAAA